MEANSEAGEATGNEVSNKRKKENRTNVDYSQGQCEQEEEEEGRRRRK